MFWSICWWSKWDFCGERSADGEPVAWIWTVRVKDNQLLRSFSQRCEVRLWPYVGSAGDGALEERLWIHSWGTVSLLVHLRIRKKNLEHTGDRNERRVFQRQGAIHIISVGRSRWT